MKTKEAIRRDIIHYANLTWDVNNLNNMNSLVQLMIEETSHELFLLDNKLEEMDYSILRKLVERLSPLKFCYVRPSHTILKIDPAEFVYKLSRNTGFVLKQLPEKLREKNISFVSFTPVSETFLYNIKITHFFSNKTLWQVDDTGNKKIVKQTSQRAKYNTIWLGLNVDANIESLKGLCFYFDFKHLPDYHEYYDILSETQWSINNIPLKMSPGFHITKKDTQNLEEKEVLDFYKDHFQTIQSDINFSEIEKKILPEELVDIIGADNVSSMPPAYWISVTFPVNFLQEDIEGLFVSLNSFPVIDRHYNETIVYEKDIARGISLTSGIGQEYLNIESITDSSEYVYKQGNNIAEKGEYTIIPTKRKNINDPRIVDYLERLVDVIHDERAAFTGIDNNRVVNILNSIYTIQDKDTQKIELNRLNEAVDIALLAINPPEKISSIQISYWTTHAGLLNNLPAGTNLMANKIPELNKSEAFFLRATEGGQDFFDLESLKAINSFYLTSKGKLLTKYDILSFCRLELGKYIKSVDVVRKAVISHKLKEGIIIVMEIQITPKRKYADYLKRKGILKDLLVRMRQKSPNNFNYKIKLFSTE